MPHRRRSTPMFEPHPLPGRPAADPRTDYKEPADRERLMAQYDGDIAFGDQEFGRFLRELRSRELYDRSFILFLSDHGEEFLDHGQWLHGRSVFDELVRVPLVVKFPGQKDAGRRITTQVQTVDLVPTIFESLGLPQPEGLAGLPLQRAIRDEPKGLGQAKSAGQTNVTKNERPAVSEISHRGIVAHGLRTTQDKYIRRFSPEEDELYFDLHEGPEGEDRSLGVPRRARPEAPRGRRGGHGPQPLRLRLARRGQGRAPPHAPDGRMDRAGDNDGFRHSGSTGGLRERSTPRASRDTTTGPAAGRGLHASARGCLRLPRRDAEREAPDALADRPSPKRAPTPRRFPFALPSPRGREGDAEGGAKSRGNLFGLQRATHRASPSGWPFLRAARSWSSTSRPRSGSRPSATWATDDPSTSSSSTSTALSSTRSTDLAQATNDAMASLLPGRRPSRATLFARFVGDGAQKLIARAIAHARAPLAVEDVLPLFLDCYAKRLLETTRAYDGIPEALDALRHLQLAVLTNKPGNLSRALLEGLGLSSRVRDDPRPGRRSPHGNPIREASFG